jgi:hypothetical protein
MPNAIKYSLSAQTLALKKGNFYIGTGDVGKGPTSTTDYYNGITPPSGGYTIYLNKASGGPSIYTASNDSALISLSNTIAGQTFATAAAALDWYNSQSDKMVFNSDYPAIITNGLVLNLDAGFTPSYPTTGTTWYDVSSGGNNGALTNGPTFSSANGGSIVFDGVDDYARVSDINTASEISIEGWVYANSVGSFNAIASQFKADTFAESSWVLETVGSDIRLYITNNSLLSFASTSFSTLVWTYIVGTFNGTTIKIYKNSVLGDITGTIAGLNDSNLNINIGALYSQNGSEGGTGLWNGKIANVKIYNRALSADEVLQNYNATKSRFGL